VFFARPPAGTRLGPLFHRVWAAVTISSVGDGMRSVAMPLLAAQITSDPRRIALAALAGQLPFLLFSLPADVLSDRVDRRRILWIVDAPHGGRGLVACVCSLGIGIVSAVWTVMVVSLRQTVTPTEQLGRVSMVIQMVTVGAGALGAPIAGAIAHALAPRAPILIGAAALFGCLISMRAADTT
jgi:MFS family permease